MFFHSRSGRIRSLLRTTTGRVGLVSLLALVAAAVVYTGAQAASCATGFPLVAPPSCFEAGDGNTAAGAGKTDWANHGNVVTFKDDTRDTQFSGGDKENDPGAWTIVTPPLATPSAISPGKDEVLAGAIAGELVPSTVAGEDDHVFVYGAFERLPQTGNSTIAFELNQKPPKPATATQPKLPDRSEGDLFISFDGGVGNVSVRLCVWHGDDKGETTNSAYGWYSLPGFGQPGAVKLSGGGNCTRIDDVAAGNKATGFVNAALFSPGTPLTPAFSSSLGIGAFGEMSVDLTRSLNKLASAGTADACFGFGSMMIHTRTSDTGSAAPKDYVEPQSIPKLSNCALELEKKVARDVPGPGALTFENADTAGTAVGARTTDALQYRFEVKNPSDFPFPLASIALTELTTAGCDANPAGPTNPDGTAVDGTLNKNETWIYTCTRSAPLPTGSLENEAKVTGTVNTKEVASATDKAFANVVNPSIDVEKTGPAMAYEGDNVTFTVTADNTGNDPITNVVVTDAQCDPLLTAANASGDTDNDDVLDTSETWSWSCVVKNTTGTSLLNTAQVDGTDSLGGNVSDSDGHTVALINPSVDVTKTGPATAYEGSDVTFTVTADNDGNDPITNVVVTDAQCDPLLTAANATGDTNNDDILDTNETWSWSCVVKSTTGTSLSNTADVAGKDSLNGNVSDSDGHTVALIDPSIYVTKGGPATAYSGDDVTFTVTADNTGNDPITNVIVTDPQCDPLLTAANAGGDTDNDDVLDTTETWTWNCVVKNTTGTSVTNTATVAGKDTLNGNVTDNDNHMISLITPSIDVTKSGPTTAYEGSDVTFTVTADNDGNDPITGVVVTDAQCDPLLTAANASGDTDNDDVLDTNETWTWDCVVKSVTGTSLSNTATVAGKDTLNGDVSDNDDHTVALIKPSIDVTKTGPTTAQEGSDVTFTVTADNDGNDPITGVVVTDAQCDPLLTAANATGDTNNDDILDTNETWSWSCVVKNATGTSLSNTAKVEGKDTLNGDVSDTDDHTVRLINASIDVTKSGPATAYSGSDVTFTVTAENDGNDPITGVVVTDAQCDPLLTAANAGGDTNNDDILDTDETWTWNCVVKNATGTSKSNTATVAGKDTLNADVSDTDDHTVNLISPSIAVTKSGPTTAYEGSDVTFTVTAENDGDDPITGVVVTDAQCDPLLTAANAGGDTNNNDILDTNETWTWDCVVKNVSGTSLSNTATVAGKDTLNGDVSDSDDHTVALINPGLDVTKTGPSMAHVGDDVTFTVTAENTGNDPITNVTVIDAQCDPQLTAAGASGDTNNDDVLDTTETWSWDCVVKNVTGTTLTNTVEVKGKDTLNGDVTDTDGHTVDLIDPELDVTKTGPASVPHGATITWTITAENTGDDPISNVTIKDDPCDPKLSNTPDSGDTGGDGVLGVGETWTWTCTTVAPSSGTSVKNVATVSGTDSLRDDVTDTDDATTQLSPVPVPPVVVEPQPSRAIVGEAAFRQKATQNCVTKQFRLDVTGREIAKVTFTVDGKVAKVLSKGDATGLWSFKVNPSLKDTKRHRVNAIVEYLPGAAVKSKTLSYLYQRCTCISRRNFRIRVRTRRADPVIRATVYVNGKRVQVVRGKRLNAPVKLIGLPKGRITVKIVATRKSGKKVTGVRKYYTCRVKSKKKTIPEL